MPYTTHSDIQDGCVVGQYYLAFGGGLGDSEGPFESGAVGGVWG